MTQKFDLCIVPTVLLPILTKYLHNEHKFEQHPSSALQELGESPSPVLSDSKDYDGIWG